MEVIQISTQYMFGTVNGYTYCSPPSPSPLPRLSLVHHQQLHLKAFKHAILQLRWY